MTKKGAIELSMTTIIVIVLGVTLLILGFVFIKGIFGSLGGISDTTFDKAQTLLTGLESVDSFLTVSPSMITIEQGSDDVVKVIVANLEQDAGSVNVNLRSRSRDDDQLKCLIFHDTANSEGSATSAKTIESGKQESYSLIVQDVGGPLRTTACYVVAEGGPATGNTGAVTVRVIKSGGILG